MKALDFPGKAVGRICAATRWYDPTLGHPPMGGLPSARQQKKRERGKKMGPFF